MIHHSCPYGIRTGLRTQQKENLSSSLLFGIFEREDDIGTCCETIPTG